MSEANKIVARRLVEEAFNKGNYGVIEELVAPTIVNHDPATGGETGVAGGGERSRYRSAFPDVKITIEEQVAEGDLVASRWTATGTHKGELMGISPTGKESTVTGLTIDKIKDGKIVESWTNWDTLGMLQSSASFRRWPPLERRASAKGRLRRPFALSGVGGAHADADARLADTRCFSPSPSTCRATTAAHRSPARNVTSTSATWSDASTTRPSSSRGRCRLRRGVRGRTWSRGPGDSRRGTRHARGGHFKKASETGW